VLKRINRLKSRGDFKRTLAGLRLCANDCFALYGLLGPSESTGSSAVSEPRIGFIVSKKVHKRAVQRNRIRRRLRELVRTSLLTERRQILSQYKTLVFIARSGCVDACFQTLAQRMERCLASLKKS
jgi:ribonuclease P protein component